MDVLVPGVTQPGGMVVDGSSVLLTDAARGTLVRIDGSGRREVILRDLQRPGDIAMDAFRNLFIIESGAGRVLRVDPAGSIGIAAGGLRQPESIAAGPDGRIWVALRRGRPAMASDDGGGRGSEYVLARLEASGEVIPAADGLVGVNGMTVDATGVYVAVSRLDHERGRSTTVVARIPFDADGAAGPVESVLTAERAPASAIAVDPAGSLLVAFGSKGRDGQAEIVKRRRSGEISRFATGLARSVDAAFAPDGDLLIVERRDVVRVLRFHAPPPAVVRVPAYTNRTRLAVPGIAVPGGRVDVFEGPGVGRPLAAAIADPETGRFSVEVPIVADGEADLAFIATAAAGAGLASPPSRALIVHDGHLPRAAVLEPQGGAHVRTGVRVEAFAEDDESGVASLTFMLDDAVVATAVNERSARTMSAGAVVGIDPLPDGMHTLTVVVDDRAGNVAAVSQLLVLDRIPPDTVILTGPPARTADRTVTFTAAGIDAQSPSLVFSWRLDGGSWSSADSASQMVLGDLTPGLHRFEVRARDLAGNDDTTPAAQEFTVSPMQIHIVEPVSGATVTPGWIWLRGTVEGAPSATVTVAVPAQVRQDLGIPAITAPVIAGTFVIEVPVAPEAATLVVEATDGAGGTAVATIEVAVSSDLQPAITLGVEPPAGVAPHVVRFAAPDADTAAYAVDLDADGIFDDEGDDLQAAEFLYATPGVYLPVLRVTAASGQSSIGRAPVIVYDRAALESQVRTVWAGFKAALRSGDVPTAVSYVHSGRRAQWADYFDRFSIDGLAAIDDVFTELAVLGVEPGRVECEMLLDVGGLQYSFPVSLLVDGDGRWRLWQF